MAQVDFTNYYSILFWFFFSFLIYYSINYGFFFPTIYSSISLRAKLYNVSLIKLKSIISGYIKYNNKYNTNFIYIIFTSFLNKNFYLK